MSRFKAFELTSRLFEHPNNYSPLISMRIASNRIILRNTGRFESTDMNTPSCRQLPGGWGWSEAAGI